MAEDTSPVLIGAGQLLQRDVPPAESLDPVQMMAEAARRAEADAGARLLSQVDVVAVVDVLGWHASNPARLLSEALGAKPAREIVTSVGGNSPQALINKLSADVASGRVRTALIAGTNAIATLRRARKAGVTLAWPTGGEGTPEAVGDSRLGSSAYENDHSLFLPVNVYPLFENALRASRGLDPETHNERIGRMFAPFTRVAAANPYAWFPVERSAQEIAHAGPSNRMVAFPYTKFMNAVMEVDQAAALLLTSADAARAAGVASERFVYFWGGGEAAEDPWFVSERPSLVECPAMRFAGETALARAGVSIAEIDCIDLYSCFPVAVEMACDMLGLREDDPRGLTVTGGLPYFGGPGNNYTTHAIATMVERLRARPGSRGFVTANGWYLTKHAAGVYASEPRPTSVAARPLPDPASSKHRGEAVTLAVEAEGRGRIETYTVVHGRDGAPTSAIVVGRLDDGRRFLANTSEDRALLEGLTVGEAIGRTGSVSRYDGTNIFSPD